MEKKKYIAILGVVCIIAAFSFVAFNKKNHSSDNIVKKDQTETIENANENKQIRPTDTDSKISETSNAADNNEQDVKKASIEIEDSYLSKTNLYNNGSGIDVPLSTIGLLSEMPQVIQEKVAAIAENNNIFMTKRHNDKLLIITDNPNNIRHCIEFNEISIKNGHQIKTTLGYNDKMQDSDNDIWEYDETTKQPIRHSKYDKNGDVEFVETWYYDDNPVKYEMKDADGHVLSMRKETLDGGTNLRVEHLLYDKAGNTKVNVSAIYEGADVKRFTYYNADKPSDGGSVFSEYDDGLKTKETVYTNDLKVENSYTAEYKDGIREEITVLDKNNKEIKKLVPEVSPEVL